MKWTSELQSTHHKLKDHMIGHCVNKERPAVGA